MLASSAVLCLCFCADVLCAARCRSRARVGIQTPREAPQSGPFCSAACRSGRNIVSRLTLQSRHRHNRATATIAPPPQSRHRYNRATATIAPPLQSRSARLFCQPALRSYLARLFNKTISLSISFSIQNRSNSILSSI